MLPNPFLAELEEIGAIHKKGHYVLASGIHSTEYVEKEKVFLHPKTVCRLTDGIAIELTARREFEADLVLGPDSGGAMLSSWLAYNLGQRTGRDILAAYAKSVAVEFEPVGATAGFAKPLRDTEFAIRPAYARALKGKRVVLIEDVITTGGTIQRLAQLAMRCHAQPVAVVTLIDRGGMERLTEILIRFALGRIAFNEWEPERCPRCAESIPVNTDLGHGAEFVRRLGRTQRS